MSGVLRRGPLANAHERARALAAARIDEPLEARDDAWLDRHLRVCDACRAVSDAYREQRLRLRALRSATLVPPRDLWARTAAAIEAEGRSRRGRSRLLPRTLPVAPLAGLLVVAVVVGAGMFNGVSLFPAQNGTTTGFGTPLPTPIAVAAGDVVVLSRGRDGSLELATRKVDQVCPVGAPNCALSGAADRTPLSTVGDLGTVEGVISPDRDQIIVMQRGTAGGVYVVPMTEKATPSPTGPPSSAGPATPSPTASPAATGKPAASARPVETQSPEERPSPTDGPGPSATPAASPGEPTPAPTVAVAPATDGTLEIARDVVLVGNVSGYSADGRRFAFTARPADGSAGPDVYVWRTGDDAAHPITTDQTSLFAGWLGDQLLVSSVADRKPELSLVDPATGTSHPIGRKTMWNPAVAPDEQTAVWWNGTIKPSADGFTWLPADGKLVLGSWPDGGDRQVLANGPVRDWQVRWDETGRTLALWVSGAEAGAPGRLSLYAVDRATGAANLDKPLLDNDPALGDFSLRSGRLAWAAPADDGDTAVKVLAWSGDNVGQLQLSTGPGVTVLH